MSGNSPDYRQSEVFKTLEKLQYSYEGDLNYNINNNNGRILEIRCYQGAIGMGGHQWIPFHRAYEKLNYTKVNI